MNTARTFTAIALLSFATTANANLITNGSFELPGTPAAGFVSYNFADDLGGWNVGRLGGVNDRIVWAVSSTFVDGAYAFPASAGSTWVDLTGAQTGVQSGVSQSLSFAVGQSYTLSFDVGNVSGSRYGQTSTVKVLYSNQVLGSFTNSTPGTTMNWERFTVTFVAGFAQSPVTFLNDDPQGDNVNGLDNIVLERTTATTVIPVPGALPLLLSGLAVFGLAGRARLRA